MLFYQNGMAGSEGRRDFESGLLQVQQQRKPGYGLSLLLVGRKGFDQYNLNIDLRGVHVTLSLLM